MTTPTAAYVACDGSSSCRSERHHAECDVLLVRPGQDPDPCGDETYTWDAHHPCVCGAMRGHIGRHYCTCGRHWLPVRAPSDGESPEGYDLLSDDGMDEPSPQAFAEAEAIRQRLRRQPDPLTCDDWCGLAVDHDGGCQR